MGSRILFTCSLGVAAAVVMGGMAACGESLEVNESPPPSDGDGGGAVDSAAVPVPEGGSVPPPADASFVDGPQPRCALPTSPIVFVTSQKFNGLLGGPQADAICTDAAKRAGFGDRTFIAFISQGASTPFSLLPSPHGSWSLPTGQVVFQAGDTIGIAMPKVAINVTENCDALVTPGDSAVWTGSNANASASKSCQDWSSDMSSQMGSVGNRAKNDIYWASGGDRPCSDSLHLYCFEK